LGARAARGLVDLLEQGIPFSTERIPAQFIPRQSSLRTTTPPSS
jgi:hypothetical protein